MSRFRPSHPLRPLAAAGVSLLLVLPEAPAAGQDRPAASPIRLEPLVVTATRHPTAASRVGSSVTVITREEIERRQLRTLPDALRGVPGVDVLQTGGPGGVTSVFMRGANPNHTKVLIDGIEANDPSNAGGAFDFGQILTAGIERIEVLRGPQSGLYGSDAIGGVISITTRRGEGPPRVTASGEGGSFETFNQTAGLSGSTDRFDYSFDVGHFRSGDTPVTPRDLLPPGRERIGDRHDNLTFATRLGAALTDNFGLAFTARYLESSLLFTGDDFSTFPSTPAAAQSRSENEELFTRGEARLSLLDGRLEQRFGLAYTDYDRLSASPAAGFIPAQKTTFRGDRLRADWQADFALAENHLLTGGAEYGTERLRDSPVSAERDNYAGFLQLQSAFADRLFTTLSVRGDVYERFGDAVTWRIAASAPFRETGTTVRASYGTAFKAPSLTQLFVDFPGFNFFGNPDLRPEKSRGFDAGFEQEILDGRASFGLTGFYNDITNLITPNATSTSYENLSSAETWGFEAFAAATVFDGLELRADYTYTRARDGETGQQLIRRPKHKASASARWQASKDADLTLTALYVGERFDGNRDFSIPRLKADGYFVVDLGANYALTETLAAFARVENLFDERYEDPVGYLRPGIGAFIGLRLSFDAAAFGS